MKMKDIKELTDQELNSKLNDLKAERFNLSTQNKTGQLENTGKIKKTKKDIARLSTEFRIRQNG